MDYHNEKTGLNSKYRGQRGNTSGKDDVASGEVEVIEYITRS